MTSLSQTRRPGVHGYHGYCVSLEYPGWQGSGPWRRISENLACYLLSVLSKFPAARTLYRANKAQDRRDQYLAGGGAAFDNCGEIAPVRPHVPPASRWLSCGHLARSGGGTPPTQPPGGQR